MEHLIFGHTGAPVLVFPTSKGRFYQWEDFQMIEALRYPLSMGWLQLFCVDSIDNLSWYNLTAPPRIQLDWHLAYESYLLEEFLPFVSSVNSTPFLIAAGTSFGAFHAVNFALRYPQYVARVVALSGDYRSQPYLNDYEDEDVLANSPLDYLESITPHELHPSTHAVEFRLGCGRHDFCLGPTVSLANQLSRLGLHPLLSIWDHPGSHDWPLWRQQIVTYL